MQYHKLGKLPAAPHKPTDLYFAKYRLTKGAAPVALPPRPAKFGFTWLMHRPWGMLANDRLGDCVVAGSMHVAMLQAQLVGKIINFSDDNAVQCYSEATGYNPSDPSTDQGTDMAAFMDYWKNTGLIDVAGNRHKLAAWMRLNVQDLDEVREAMWIFKALALGIQFPASAMDQTNNNDVWDVVPGSPIEGGHCIGAGSQGILFNCWTWGNPQGITDPFLRAFLEEGYIPMSMEMFDGEGHDTNGYDLAQLQADAADLGADEAAPSRAAPSRVPGFSNVYEEPKTIEEADADLAEVLRLALIMAQQAKKIRPESENFAMDRLNLQTMIHRLLGAEALCKMLRC